MSNASIGIVPYQGYYELLMPRSKYPKCFCTEEEIAIAEGIREFVQKEMMPRRHDFEGGYHKDPDLAKRTCYAMYKELWKMGLCRSVVPEKYGGLGLSPIVRGMINEELSRADIGVATMIGKLHWVVSFLVAAGRDDLLEEFRSVWSGDDPYFFCVFLTEPQGGANIEDPAFGARYVRTTAKVDGDEWVINGHKLWPGPSGPAEGFVTEFSKGHMGYFTLAKDEPHGGLDTVGIYLIPADTPGLEFSALFEKSGQYMAEENREIWLNDVRIPKRYRIDTKLGEGGHLLMAQGVPLARMASCHRLCGLAGACLEIALDWTAEREIAGKPVREHSLFASIIGDCFRRLEAARALCLSIGWQAMHADEYGPLYSHEFAAKCSAARYNAGRAAEYIIARSMELLGSYGYIYDYQLEKYRRDYQIATMWLGGAQRDLLDISQGLYGLYKWPGQEEWEKSGMKNVLEGWVGPTPEEVRERRRVD